MLLKNLNLKNYLNFTVIITLSILLLGCTWGNQPVVWSKSGSVDFNKKVYVTISKTTDVPAFELDFLKNDIQNEVGKLFNNNSTGNYCLTVTITKFDEGDSGMRFVLAGLGQMYLYGTVSLVDTTAKVTIKEGEFKKNYSVGGLVGASATMRKDMSSKVSQAIVKALKDAKK